MSSPSAPRFAVPFPRPGSSASTSAGGPFSETPRSSFDRGQATALNGHHHLNGNGNGSIISNNTGESSRRPSSSSNHHSPVASSSRRHFGNVELDGINVDAQGAQGSGGTGRGLPRITTSQPDEGAGGPRSAPIGSGGSGLRVNGSGAGLDRGSVPPRSSSSPDPWTTSFGFDKGSPTEPRSGQPPPLGAPFPVPYPRRASPADLGTGAVPPRTSSFADTEKTLLNRETERSMGSRETERTLSNRPSQPSLTDESVASTSPTQGSVATATADDPVPRVLGQSVRQARSRGEPTFCGQCGQQVHGQFVRAMGKVYHLKCFRCKDCNKVVAQKFFPVEDGEGMYPLCERDYFARLDLICAKCDQALRSSYITACGEKYHVEHFTCSECDTVFGPNDSYYEHSGKVYCHFHYSTRFAVRCVGCETAILKQFVEMNRNGRDECWHPECYMISKFWNVRLASKNFNTPSSSAVSSAVSLLEMTPALTADAPLVAKESPELSPLELKDRQDAMEMKVLQIWHVLSGYEETSAGLIGEMLRAVNTRNLLEIILLAERFILHVETLFAVIDDLEAQFAVAGVKGMSHAREAKQLCRKLVNLFSTMSQISPTGPAPPQAQELFTLITQLAHYLKILIRIALTGSIKLERDQGRAIAMTNCLARLNLLYLDGSDPTVKKRGDWPEVAVGAMTPNGSDEDQLRRAIDNLTRRPQGFIPSTQDLAYGYRSLASEVTGETTLRGPHDEEYIPPEACNSCKQAIEEDCIRLGMFNRWHSACVQCRVCGERAEEEPPGEVKKRSPRLDFYFEPVGQLEAPREIYCAQHRTKPCVGGFAAVSRLEQYAFLLHIAMRRLYVHFRVHHELPSVRDHGLEDAPGPDVKRMKSVTLDRKLSSTARLPQRSMVVESPAGRMADENGQVVSARSQAALAPDDPEIDGQPQSATLDVIRPPFARNNTSVLIINENNDIGDDNDDDIVVPALAMTRIQEDDAITLGDIPHLADQTILHRPPSDNSDRPLLSSLNQLQSLIIKHFSLLQLQKTGLGHLIELDEVLELLDIRKSQWWNKIFKGNAKKDQKKKGVFGVPIEVLVERTGSDTQQGASSAVLRVPEFIEDIVSTMRQMDMAVEGIFRKNGNIRKLQQISEALDKDSTVVNLSEENPVQLAALLKRFLRELPDPLLTFRLHKLFCAAASMQNPDDRMRCLHLLVTLLPRYNRDTMEILFVFLRWVASFSYRDEETGSRMDMANLATVICPSILYAKGANAARDESFIAIEAVQDLLENQDEYYLVPSELQFVINENIYNIFAKELDLPPKEIHRHCSKYMQARGTPQVQPPPRVPASSSGVVRDRPSDSRLSVRASEGNLTGAGSAEGLPPTPTPFRQTPTGHPPTAIQTQGQPSAQQSQQQQQPPPPLSASRPTSWAKYPAPGTGSQQSIHHNLHSPSTTPWRGPFQGNGNGSRNSSRGSAPSSPGPEERERERRSIQMDRERTRTPVQPGSVGSMGSAGGLGGGEFR